MQNLDGCELGEGGYYRRIRRVRSRQSLKERVWLPGKRESFNIHVKKNFVSHHQPASDKGKLQYYYVTTITTTTTTTTTFRAQLNKDKDGVHYIAG